MSRRAQTTIRSMATLVLGLVVVACGSVTSHIDDEPTSSRQEPELSQFAALPTGVRFEVVSVREMSPEESSRRTPGDVIGLDVLVRIRLSTDDIGVRMWNPHNHGWIYPISRCVAVEDGKPIPRPSLGNFGGGSRDSWILPPHSAFEWDGYDSISCDAATRAFTVFLISGPEDQIVEVVSEPYEALLAPKDHWKCNVSLEIWDPKTEMPNPAVPADRDPRERGSRPLNANR